MSTRALPLDRPGPLAWLVLAVTILIWGGYLVVARAAAREALGPVEIGLLRFVPAAALFAPVWLRMGLKPRHVRWRDAAIVGIMGGFCFVSLLALGVSFAPAADAGVFAPSMLPFFVAVLSFLLLGERFTSLRLAGFGLILFGALAVGGWEALARSAEGAWRGHILLLCASFSWAAYTVVYRRSGLRAIEAAAIITLWSAAGFLLWAAVGGTALPETPWRTIAFHAVAQGVFSGFVATFTYGYALTAIGASRTAAFAALVPVIAALGGLAFLGEPLGAVKALGIAITATGVLLASGAVRL
jgi:drug/metabolite transporter (DMT)-like permease